MQLQDYCTRRFGCSRTLISITILFVVAGTFSIFRKTPRYPKNVYAFDLKRNYFRRLSLKKILAADHYSSSTTTVDTIIIRGFNEGAAASLNNCKMKLSSMSPSIGGKPHFEGTVIVQSRNSQKKLQVHLSTPGKDPNWYITIDDVIKYDQNGNNLTPVVAYTKVGLQNSVPWKEKVTWNVHVAGASPWRESNSIVMEPHSKISGNDLQRKIIAMEHDLKYLLLT